MIHCPYSGVSKEYVINLAIGWSTFNTHRCACRVWLRHGGIFWKKAPSAIHLPHVGLSLESCEANQTISSALVKLVDKHNIQYMYIYILKFISTHEVTFGPPKSPVSKAELRLVVRQQVPRVGRIAPFHLTVSASQRTRQLDEEWWMRRERWWGWVWWMTNDPWMILGWWMMRRTLVLLLIWVRIWTIDLRGVPRWAWEHSRKSCRAFAIESTHGSADRIDRNKTLEMVCEWLGCANGVFCCRCAEILCSAKTTLEGAFLEVCGGGCGCKCRKFRVTYCSIVAEFVVLCFRSLDFQPNNREFRSIQRAPLIRHEQVRSWTSLLG